MGENYSLTNSPMAIKVLLKNSESLYTQFEPFEGQKPLLTFSTAREGERRSEALALE